MAPVKMPPMKMSSPVYWNVVNETVVLMLMVLHSYLLKDLVILEGVKTLLIKALQPTVDK